ncbi:ExeM/NucH family extracellular endonuclease [Demequina sp.]|uniref:ExeM/NucH family extracellular endonuclease n=1 Tax=Demequina sp. TaxID=2050685 RepID=UPI003D0B17BE
MPARRRAVALITSTSLLAASLAAGAVTTAAAAASDLFFSEYIEGTSNNKALEIYNGTGADVDLAGYSVAQYSNGATTAGLTFNLTGTLAAGDVFVIAHASSDPLILAQADLTSGAGLFNGDDALALIGPSGTLDVIGQIGVDPGAEWGTGLTSTADNTLRRLPTVCSGRTDGSTAFDPATEWAGYATNTFDGLGAHTASCGGGPADAAPVVGGVSPADGAGDVDPGAAVTLTFSEDVALAEGAVTLTCAGQPVAATTAGGPSVFTVTPASALPAGATCTVAVSASGVSDVDAIDPPDGLAANFSSSFTVAGTAAATPISAVQGAGDVSPLAGQTVTVEGIVVGDFEGPSPALRGFYVQSRDADADADLATSEGLFVFNGNADSVALGDEVRVSGAVSEFQGQTQLTAAGAVEVLSSGNAVTPAEVVLPMASATAFEATEGMLVHFAQRLYVTEYFQLARFGEVVLSGGDRLDQPTAVAEPGAEANALQAANNLNRIKIDDATQAQNPATILFGRGGNPLSAANPLRGGDYTDGLTGVMTYTWGGASASPNSYRVRPVQDLSDAGLVPGGTVPVFEAGAPRPSAPENVGGSLKVASFNVLNYFLTLNANGALCGPVGYEQECRGANTAQEFERQRTKLLSALDALGADVVGLMELENTPGVDAAADLAAGLNALQGTDVWHAVDTGVQGTDVIRVGAIYRSDRVTPAGAFTILNSSVDPRFDDNHHRPTLAQSFTELATGEDLTLVMNHLKSKGSCPAAGTDAANEDQGDGAGCWNAERTEAALAIVDWIAGGHAGNGDPDVVLMGDMNSYAKEDPIDVFAAAGFTDLSAGGYSYVFDGQWGYLDYALVSPTLLEQVTGITEFHINSDEVPALDYNTEFKTAAQIDSLYAPDMYRTSDHDPVLLGVALQGEPEPVPTCAVSYDAHSLWAPSKATKKHGATPGAFVAEARITNLTDTKLTSWTLQWSYGNGEKAAVALNGILKQQGADVTVKSLPLLGAIKPGKSLSVGVVGTYPSTLAEPTEFWLNGEKCLVS